MEGRHWALGPGPAWTLRRGSSTERLSVAWVLGPHQLALSLPPTSLPATPSFPCGSQRPCCCRGRGWGVLAGTGGGGTRRGVQLVGEALAAGRCGRWWVPGAIRAHFLFPPE